MMKLIATQIATAENGYGYSDYEYVLFDNGNLVIELALTVPFDETESPYMRIILGNQDERFDIDTPTTPLTYQQAHFLIQSAEAIL